MSLIHPRSRLRRVSRLANRRMKARCEIKRTGLSGPGMGEADAPDFFAGNVPCAVSVSSVPGEGDNPGMDVDSVTLYEIALPLGTAIEPADRIAVPAFFPAWQKQTNYAFGARVVPTNWVSGAAPVLECVCPGASGAIEPRKWPLKLRATKTDGTVVWRVVDRAELYEVLAVNANESNPLETVAKCKEIN